MIDELLDPNSKPIRELVDKLVAEGKRIGKCPWSCSMIAEHEASLILMKEGIMDEETMEESKKRWKKEGRYKKKAKL